MACDHVKLVDTVYGRSLYINDVEKFAEKDEYVYYESLVHPVMDLTGPKTVLIVNGGDGMALKEVLKWESIEKVYIVEPDQCVLELGKGVLSYLNNSSISDPRVEVVVDDPTKFLSKEGPKFDVIIVDYGSTNLNKEFYKTAVYTAKKALVVAGDDRALRGVLQPITDQESNKVRNYNYMITYFADVPSKGKVNFTLVSKEGFHGFRSLPRDLWFVDENFIRSIAWCLPKHGEPVMMPGENVIESFHVMVRIEGLNTVTRGTLYITNKRIIYEDFAACRSIYPEKLEIIQSGSIIGLIFTLLFPLGIPLALVLAFHAFYALIGVGLVFAPVTAVGVFLYSLGSGLFTVINDTVKVSDNSLKIYKAIVYNFNVNVKYPTKKTFNIKLIANITLIALLAVFVISVVLVLLGLA
ncbi:hypothetical protein [Stygiolobus caldivivus]|uniref:PABS domain-containing protein n=1 Tax=Stygiolobus caldivivus TaxID=2824673 RepID=A0A8D5U6D9_9CREN|nr:hypothetical protein [Stygiolobus caldivivus]BCU69848.1 hypothetical protein KN1_11450 [Stygiolobus caldivivus]